MTKHVPRHRLESLAAAGASPVASAAARAHISGCDPCAVRKRALDTARERYLRAHPAGDFARAVRARAELARPAPAPARWGSVGALLGIAAAIALGLVAIDRGWPHAEPDAVRLKGSVSLQVHARQGERTFPLHDGDALGPGDELAFAYSLSSPRHLLLLSVDDAGTVTRYFPPAGESSRRLAATARAQLPVGIELDARRGAERILALFSTSPLDENAVRRALALALARARAQQAGIEAVSRVDVDAEQVSVWFRKP